MQRGEPMAYEEHEYAALKAISHREVTKATEHLLGLCTGLVADGRLDDREVEFLNLWLKQYPEVVSTWPGKVIADRITTIVADGVITPEERQDLFETLSGIVGFQLPETGAAEAGVAAIPFSEAPCIQFEGRTFCFTGKFLFGTRAACERAILNRGSIPLDGVSTKLEYLVVGSLIEPSWAHTSYGRKIEKALDYNNKGHGIAIISERQWTEAIGQP